MISVEWTPASGPAAFTASAVMAAWKTDLGRQTSSNSGKFCTVTQIPGPLSYSIRICKTEFREPITQSFYLLGKGKRGKETLSTIVEMPAGSDQMSLQVLVIELRA